MSRRIYTSHWRSPLVALSGLQAIGVSRGTPKFPIGFDAPTCWALCPTKAEFTFTDPDDFTSAFVGRLRRLGARRVLLHLGRLPGVLKAAGIVLVCWERPGEFCHRRLVADWLDAEGYGPVPELAVDHFVDGRFELGEIGHPLGDHPTHPGDEPGVAGSDRRVQEVGEDGRCLADDPPGGLHVGELLPARRAEGTAGHPAIMLPDPAVVTAGVFANTNYRRCWREATVSARMAAGTGLAVTRKETEHVTFGGGR